MAFPEAWLNELLRRNDIASVISDYVQLTPKGGRLWGHCPFHTDKTPSFSVTPEKQLFHCFSCKAGGSVIQFVMQAENLSYVEAVRFLAQRVGMDLPEEVDDRRLMEQKRLRDRIYDANREAAMFYHELLFSPAGAGAREYLQRRGVDASTARRFGLGYSPDSWDGLIVHLSEKGYEKRDLISAGLAVPGRKNPDNTFDFFRGRLMFPVISAAGKVLGFGGRTMGQDEPKYINTGDTPVYNKRENIYAINLIKGKKLDDIIMVEGYMDVISLHQRGIGNAVASLGTALTIQQARLLKRYASRVFYAYDGDEAGQKAMLRGIDILLSAEIEPRVIVIPGGQDPDEYVKEFGPDSFLLLKDASITGTRFKLGRIAKECGTDTADGREKFAREGCALLSSLDPVERDRYIPFVAEKCGLTEDTIREQCGVAAPKAGDNSRPLYRYNRAGRGRADNERMRCERALLSCLLNNADDALKIEKLPSFSYMLFTDGDMRLFAIKLIAAYKQGAADIPLMIASMDEQSASEVSEAYAAASSYEPPFECAVDAMEKIRRLDAVEQLRSQESDPQGNAPSPDSRIEELQKYLSGKRPERG